MQVLTKLSFTMLELQSLAEKHDIQNDLHHGGGIQKVYEVIGIAYRDKFIRKKKKVGFKQEASLGKACGIYSRRSKGNCRD